MGKSKIGLKKDLMKRVTDLLHNDCSPELLSAVRDLHKLRQVSKDARRSSKPSSDQIISMPECVSPDKPQSPMSICTEPQMIKLPFYQTLDTILPPTPLDCCGIKSNNRYIVKNDFGENIFTIIEDNDCCNRTCCAAARSFIMSVFNDSNQEIIRLVQPFVCNCWGHKLEVQSPPGITIGYVRQNFHICLPKFTVENERGEPAFKIAGPCVPCTCCTDENFELLSLNEAVTDSKIFKPFSSSGPNAGVDFVVRFPSDLEVKMKATLLGACILIDCLYYEKTQRPLLLKYY
ncbi:phospholipid scramblase 1-like [Ctenopharyngodon idella]|uniref:phospholipid scramblase 1-like n=1 Tax=Ctenopharyngodon idella TaxID=7959 RepID=UPI0022311D24|nr:phospholipid scramblase 1-like [Ctenopharyngodon idella]